MRTFGLLALFGAAAGFLLCTDKGRQLTREAGSMLREQADQLRSRLEKAPEVTRVVESVLAQPHPDTPVARAFEEALA
jgi:hypothetical protein